MVSSYREEGITREEESRLLCFLMQPNDDPELQYKVARGLIRVRVTNGDRSGCKRIDIRDNKDNVLLYSANQSDPKNLIPLQ